MAVRKKGATASREIAIYLRLSSTDGTEAESNSIGNQRSYLHQWAAREGWQIVAEFLDDGHTGTDFERPGFRALMAALQENRFHCGAPGVPGDVDYYTAAFASCQLQICIF